MYVCLVCVVTAWHNTSELHMRFPDFQDDILLILAHTVYRKVYLMYRETWWLQCLISAHTSVQDFYRCCAPQCVVGVLYCVCALDTIVRVCVVCVGGS